MKSEQEQIIAISNALDLAASKLGILRNIAWPKSVQIEFFKHNAQKLPDIVYPPFNSEPVFSALAQARQAINQYGNETIVKWASRIADKLESSARLLETRGTRQFFQHSKQIYGSPTDILPDGISSPLDLALHFGRLFDHVKHFDLGIPPSVRILPEDLAAKLAKAAGAFGEDAPAIMMDDTIASKAIAGRRRIAISPSADFSEKDVQQLIEHEVNIHVVTSINGHRQKKIKILGDGHCGTTSTQEGLAVFAEFLTGSIDLDRARRLSDRVLATQKAIEGADFIELYRHCLEKTDNQQRAFDDAKRICRGADLHGGSAFTKDIVYLEGLVKVQHFLSAAVAAGRLDLLDLLFSGKLDLADIPALKIMQEMDLIEHPKYLPHWIVDKHFLLTHLSYSNFLSDSDSSTLNRYYQHIFEDSCEQ